MSQQTFLLASAAAMYGLYYTWRSRRNEALILAYNTNQEQHRRRRLKPNERSYVEFIFSENSIQSVLERLLAILRDDYCFDLNMSIRSIERDKKRVFTDYVVFLERASTLYLDFRSSRDKNSFFKQWMQTFPVLLPQQQHSTLQDYFEKTIQANMKYHIERITQRLSTSDAQITKELVLQAFIDAQCVNTVQQAMAVPRGSQLYLLVHGV